MVPAAAKIVVHTRASMLRGAGFGVVFVHNVSSMLFSNSSFR